MRTTALAIVADKKYLDGLNTLLTSIYRNSKSIINKVDKVLITTDIQYHPWFDKIIKIEEYNNTNAGLSKLNGAFKKFEAFNLKDYKRVIYLDSDMLCLNDFSFLLSHELDEYDFACVNGLKERINSGLMVINNKICDTTYDKLINKSKYGTWKFGDQSVINEIITGDKYNICYLDKKFNFIKTQFLLKPVWNKHKDNLVFLHFVGEKPWIQRTILYEELEEIWINYKKEVKEPEDNSWNGITNEKA